MIDVFDAHFHIIDHDYPIVENNGFKPDEFRLYDYFEQCRALDLEPRGGAIVSGSFQGFDQDYLINALSHLPKTYVGVAQLPLTLSDEALKELHHYRIRAIRYNLYRNMVDTSWQAMIDFSRKVQAMFGWHTELYVDLAQFDQVFALIDALDQVVVDHLGFSEIKPAQLDRLLNRGVRFKASGFGRISMDPMAAMQHMMAINPGSVLFGTDLPGTRARRRISTDDIEQIQTRFDAASCRRIFVDNAAELYLKNGDKPNNYIE